MDELAASFGAQAECFASPLNRRLPKFFSAFADTDAPFGSSGNFFAAARTGALRSLEAAEVGPPYDDQLMRMAVEQLDAELSARDGPGTFVLVVPDWRGPPPSAFWSACERSAHLSHVLVLDKDAHRYTEGFQHQRSSSRTRFVLGECASLCIFLQNAAGRAQHPVAEDALARLSAAWNVPEPRAPKRARGAAV